MVCGSWRMGAVPWLLALCLMLAAGCAERPAPAAMQESEVELATPAPATPQPAGPETSAPEVAGFDLDLVIDPPGAGFVVAVPPFGPYAPGSTVVLSVIPPRVPPYVFSQWAGDGAEAGAKRAVSVVMDSDKRVVARFINPYVTPPPAAPE